MKKIFTQFLALVILCSCGKKGDALSLEERQKQQEEQQPLKSNELLEREGLRFRVMTSIADPSTMDVELKLYKGAGTSKSTTPLTLSKDGHMNYSIVSSLMENNADYTLTIEYKAISQQTTYVLHTEGFTSIRSNKEFVITGHSFNASDVGKTRDLMLIKKGILKFTVYEL